MPGVLVKNSGKEQSLKGLASRKDILGSYWKSFYSKFMQKENKQAYILIFIYLHT